tara:strand:+ start:25232 stop:25717 length:486 start_codon:yes stop_codon:yes gene_type:complete
MLLRNWRIRSKMTGDQLGQLCGVGGHAIRAYERGERKPRPDVAKQIEEITNGAVTAAQLLGLSSEQGMREDAGAISGELAAHSENNSAGSCLKVSLPSGLLEAAREYGLDAEALVLEGGRDKLEAEVRREFSERNAEAIEWSRKHIAEHGTFGQRFGVFRY